MQRRRLKLLDARPLSSTVRELTLGAVDGQPLPFRSGQFWNFYLPSSAGELKRSYSLAAAPAEAQDRLQVAVTRVAGGEGSQFLHALALGEELEADGPHGLFMAPPQDVPILFVAAGTGLSPLRAMLQERLPRPQAAPLALLFGCRTPDDLLWGAELRAWVRAQPRFRLEVTLSRPPAGWSGRQGYVQSHVRELVEAWSGPRPQVYICGLSALVQDVRRVLKEELQYDRRAIHSERYD
jgi:CDP-4-dehydro-6-deoxyglucose reductase